MNAQMFLKAGAVFSLLAALYAPQALADVSSVVCRYDSHGSAAGTSTNCPTETSATGSSLRIDNAYDGLRVNSSWYGKTPVDVHSYCRYLDNISGTSDSFVPLKLSTEWESFRNHYPADIFRLVTCARPYTWKNAYGPTSVQTDKGDSGDAQYADADLPYARTWTTWTGSKTFNNSCYGNDSISNYCFETGTCCDAYGGNCTSCCKQSGSKCTDMQDYPWFETWTMTALALNSDEVDNPSWSLTSSARTGGTTRPSQCLKRCTQHGYTCDCDQQTAPAAVCSLPAAVSVSISCVLIGGVSGSGPVFEVNYALVIMSYQSRIQAALASGDCETASSIQNELNGIVTGMNKACDNFWTANPQFGIQ